MSQHEMKRDLYIFHFHTLTPIYVLRSRWAYQETDRCSF